MAAVLVLILLLPSQIGAAENTATKTLDVSTASQKQKDAVAKAKRY